MNTETPPTGDPWLRAGAVTAVLLLALGAYFWATRPTAPAGPAAASAASSAPVQRAAGSP